MCIIVVQPTGKSIPRERLKNCFDNNADGAGYMYVENRVLKIRKGFFTFDSFYQAYKLDHVVYGISSPFILHFRIATHGNVDRTNCHPHSLNKNLAFAHNGIFHNVSDIEAKKSKSDSMRAAIIFKQLPIDWFYKKGLRVLVETFFNEAQSFGAFLDNQKQVWLTDKKSWVKNRGIYYSNETYDYTPWKSLTKHSIGYDPFNNAFYEETTKHTDYQNR